MAECDEYKSLWDELFNKCSQYNTFFTDCNNQDNNLGEFINGAKKLQNKMNLCTESGSLNDMYKYTSHRLAIANIV